MAVSFFIIQASPIDTSSNPSTALLNSLHPPQLTYRLSGGGYLKRGRILNFIHRHKTYLDSEKN